MRLSRSGKAAGSRPRTVGVITSATELDRAASLRLLPDLFELRLDCLEPSREGFDRLLARLRAPLIVTARHPAEGGNNNLATARRRALLLQFLVTASYVDVELRSIGSLRAVLAEAERLGVKRIVSVHNFQRTPGLPAFRDLAARARDAAADVLKLATRVDTPAELDRLIAGFEMLKSGVPVSAMGIGRLGRESRLALIARGSVLNYAHLGTPQVEGQLSLAESRRLARSR